MRKAHPHGRIFANVRQAHELSLRRMSKFLNVTHSHLAKVEKGERLPSTNMYFALMRYIGKPMDDIKRLYGQLSSR